MVLGGTDKELPRPPEVRVGGIKSGVVLLLEDAVDTPGVRTARVGRGGGGMSSESVRIRGAFGLVPREFIFVPRDLVDLEVEGVVLDLLLEARCAEFKLGNAGATSSSSSCSSSAATTTAGALELLLLLPDARCAEFKLGNAGATSSSSSSSPTTLTLGASVSVPVSEVSSSDS